MDPTSRSSALTNTESFTPSVQPAPAATTLARTAEFSQGDTLRSETSNSSLTAKGKNPIKTHFSSLRKSAKKIFKHKSKSQEFERHSKDAAPRAPRAASETYRTGASAEFANEGANKREYTIPLDYPSVDSTTTHHRGNNLTHATLFDTLQVDSDHAHQALNPIPGPSFAMRPAPLTPSDPLPQTEIIQEIPSLVVFTPPAPPPALRASSPPTAVRPPSMTPSQPRSSRSITPPATKTKNKEFNLEAALKDIASQAVRFPPPANRSPYLDGAVISLKFLVFAVASVGMCAVALPGKCLGLLGIPSKPKPASQYLITDSTHVSKPTETHGDKSGFRKNAS